jgi:hypothetical protein
MNRYEEKRLLKQANETIFKLWAELHDQARMIYALKIDLHRAQRGLDLANTALKFMERNDKTA